MPGKKIDIPKVEREILELFLVGDSDLIVHRFAEKQKKQIADKQQKGVKGRKEDRDPEAEFQAARHLRPDGTDGFPASGVRLGAVEAVTWCSGISKKLVNGSLFVTDFDGGNLMRIFSTEPVCVTDTVRIGSFSNKVADLRYRPYYKDWFMKVRVVFVPSALSKEQVVNLINRAGMSIGLGDWRPQKGGVNGMYHVANGPETKKLEAKTKKKAPAKKTTRKRRAA
jgi:hypothetical protein